MPGCVRGCWLGNEHGGALQVHADREDLLDDLVLQVGRDAVAVLHKAQLGELSLQPDGFPAGPAAAVAQLVRRLR